MSLGLIVTLRAGEQPAADSFQLAGMSQVPGWLLEKVLRLVFGVSAQLMMSAALRLIV